MDTRSRLLLSFVALASSFAVGCNDRSAGIVGCGKDTDCKFDRICVDFMCVEPGSTGSSYTSTTFDDGETTLTTNGDPTWTTSDPDEYGGDGDGDPTTGIVPDLPMDPACFVDGESIGTGETFLYTHAAMGTNGVVYLLDNDYRQVRRYDVQADAFLEGWDIDLGATAMAVSPDGIDVYVGYENGRIDHIVDDGSKTFLVALAEEVMSLAVADDWLFAIDPSGAWESHWLIHRFDGVITATADWRSASDGIAYSAELQRVFTLRDGTSPNDIIMTDIDVVTGALGVDVDSPYHGDYVVGHPLRVFPDGVRISVSSGAIFSTTDLSYLGSLGLDYVDLGFFGDQIFSVEELGGQTQLRQLDADFSIVDTQVLYATPERLFIHETTLALFVRCGSEIGILRRAL